MVTKKGKEETTTITFNTLEKLKATQRQPHKKNLIIYSYFFTSSFYLLFFAEDYMGGSSNKVSDFEDSSYGKSRSFDPDFKGPIKDRSCTDVLCLVLFIAFLCGWAVVGIYSFAHGNPLRLIYPSNSKGEICGKGKYSDKPFLLFFDISRCFRPSVLLSGCPTPQICVEKCPDSFGKFYNSNEDEVSKKKQMTPYCGHLMTDETIQDTTITANNLIDQKICPPWWLPSRPFLKRCLPFFQSTESGENVTEETVIVAKSNLPVSTEDIKADVIQQGVKYVIELLDLRSLGEKVLSDLRETWWVVLLFLILATAVSFIWILLMRYIAAIMVWASLFISLFLLCISCVYCLAKYIQLKDKPEAEGSFFSRGLTTDVGAYTSLSTTWMVLFVFSLVLLLILVVVLLFLRKRIRIAIELIEEGSIAVADIKSSLFFPIFPFLVELLFVGWYILVALYLGSSGEQQFMVNRDSCNTRGFLSFFEEEKGVLCRNSPDGPLAPENITQICPGATCEFFRYGNTATSNKLQVYNLFGLIWSLFFVNAMEEMVMAGAFASWYFTRDRSNLENLPLTTSLYRTFRFHLGTIAFGSLIVAIIRFIRMLIDYVENKLKEYEQDNFLVKCCLCCCRCCFWCLESFVTFINRNAYIITAIYGKNFCSSAKESFSLLMRNIARVFVLDKICDFLLLLGKLVVVGSIALLAFYIFSGRVKTSDEVTNLNYYFVPVFLITMCTYFIADMFFGVYAMAVDTLFLCFLEDCERNDGSPEKPYFMSKDLRKILGKTQKEED